MLSLQAGDLLSQYLLFGRRLQAARPQLDGLALEDGCDLRGRSTSDVKLAWHRQRRPAVDLGLQPRLHDEQAMVPQHEAAQPGCWRPWCRGAGAAGRLRPGRPPCTSTSRRMPPSRCWTCLFCPVATNEPDTTTAPSRGAIAAHTPKPPTQTTRMAAPIRIGQRTRAGTPRCHCVDAGAGRHRRVLRSGAAGAGAAAPGGAAPLPARWVARRRWIEQPAQDVAAAARTPRRGRRAGSAPCRRC